MDIPVIEKDGKKIFVGQEDPNNPPVRPLEGSKMECPVCHGMFDYLLGDVKKGCESCYDRTKDTERRTNETTDKPIFD